MSFVPFMRFLFQSSGKPSLESEASRGQISASEPELVQ
jgi:hypothetical protein